MKGFIAVLLFVFAFPLFAQRQSSGWNERILFGITFEPGRPNDGITNELDSLKLRKTSYRDTVLADTLYSDFIVINDWSDGIYAPSAWFDSLGGGCDSLQLDVRLGKTFKDNNTNTNYVKFTPWYPIFTTMIHDTLYTKGIAQADSTWWSAKSGIQYRQYSTSVTADTAFHLIGHNLR